MEQRLKQGTGGGAGKLGEMLNLIMHLCGSLFVPLHMRWHSDSPPVHSGFASCNHISQLQDWISSTSQADISHLVGG